MACLIPRRFFFFPVLRQTSRVMCSSFNPKYKVLVLGHSFNLVGEFILGHSRPSLRVKQSPPSTASSIGISAVSSYWFLAWLYISSALPFLKYIDKAYTLLMFLRPTPSSFEMYSSCYELCVESTSDISKDKKITVKSVRTVQSFLHQIRITQHMKWIV